MMTPTQSRRFAVGAVVAISLSLMGCGPGKKAQCRDVLQTIQDAENQQTLGVQNRETYQKNASLYQTLADDLAAMEIKNRELQEHQAQLVAAYEDKVAAINRYIEASDEDGHLSHRVGDSKAEAEVKAVMATQQQAENKIQLAADLFYNTCAN